MVYLLMRSMMIRVRWASGCSRRWARAASRVGAARASRRGSDWRG